MSRAEILQAIRSCARKLKHNPSRRELRLTARVSEEALHKHFGGLKGALEKAGLRPSGSGFRQQESTVLLDWARVARKLGKIPTMTEYESRGGFSDMPFHTRYGNWTSVPDAFVRFARKQKIQSKWKDVLGMIGAQAEQGQHGKGTRLTRAHTQAGHLSGPSAVRPADESAGDGPRAAERNGRGVCVWHW